MWWGVAGHDVARRVMAGEARRGRHGKGRVLLMDTWIVIGLVAGGMALGAVGLLVGMILWTARRSEYL